MLLADYFSQPPSTTSSVSFGFEPSRPPPPGVSWQLFQYRSCALLAARTLIRSIAPQMAFCHRQLHLRRQPVLSRRMPLTRLSSRQPPVRRPANSGSFTFIAHSAVSIATFAGYFSGAHGKFDFWASRCTRNPGYARFDMAASYNFYRGSRHRPRPSTSSTNNIRTRSAIPPSAAITCSASATTSLVKANERSNHLCRGRDYPALPKLRHNLSLLAPWPIALVILRTSDEDVRRISIFTSPPLSTAISPQRRIPLPSAILFLPI